jgi:hypothetical protein
MAEFHVIQAAKVRVCVSCHAQLKLEWGRKDGPRRMPATDAFLAAYDGTRMMVLTA